jgi:hypothetical protein
MCQINTSKCFGVKPPSHSKSAKFLASFVLRLTMCPDVQDFLLLKIQFLWDGTLRRWGYSSRLFERLQCILIQSQALQE